MDNDAITTPTTKAIDSFGDTGQKSDRLIPNSSNGESGTFAQISHNPFFTAVSDLPCSKLRNALTDMSLGPWARRTWSHP